jgi:adenine phosphoribosyltransferase
MKKKAADQDQLDLLRQAIRDVPDFPREGIIFKDITTLLKNAELLKITVDYMFNYFRKQRIDVVAGIESRGFILGAALAYKFNCGFIPIRKPGKLPAAKISEQYQLEYGSDRIEIHQDAFVAGSRVLLVDDLLATGGTARAACNLIKRLQGEIVGLTFLIELSFLKGRQLLENFTILSLIQYD